MYKKSYKLSFVIAVVLMLSLALSACGGGSSTGSSVSSVSSSSTSSPQSSVATVEADGKIGSNYDEIVAKAKKEGTLVWWGNTPQVDSMNDLTNAFNKRFGLNIKIAQVDIHSTETTARLFAEHNAGKITVDAIGETQSNLIELQQKGLIQKIDWEKLFGAQIPLIKAAANGVVEEYKGYGLEWRHLVFGIAYNTDMVQEKDVPKTWQEILDPKWKGKVVVDSDLAPFRRMAMVMGADETATYLKNLVQMNPIYAKGSPNVTAKVVTGEAPIGITGLERVFSEQAKGAPIKPYIPSPMPLVDAQMVYIPTNAPHPNAAALWNAWLATEGFVIQAKYGIAQAKIGVPGPYPPLIQPNNLKVVTAQNFKDLEKLETLRKSIAELFKEATKSK